MARKDDTASPTSERILRAAEEVVLRDGVAHLTLEAAASEAGLSKGGVLYHFPSRTALVKAMVHRLGERFDQDLEAVADHDGRPGSFTRAYLRATIDPPPHADAARDERLGAALLAAISADPDLLAPLVEYFARWQQALDEDGLEPPGRATVVRLAADGLWLLDLVGLASLSPAQRAGAVAELKRLAQCPRDDGGGGPGELGGQGAHRVDQRADDQRAGNNYGSER